MEAANEHYGTNVDNLTNHPLVVKVCAYGRHRFMSRDRFAICEPCRLKLRKRREAKRKTKRKPRLSEWIVKSEQEMEELLKTLEIESGYNYVTRQNRKTEIAPGRLGFYRVYCCPRWNKSKLPAAPITAGLSMQEAFLAEQQRHSTVHPCNRHWLRKPRLGIGCTFKLVAKTQENGDIHVYKVREHIPECHPVEKAQLAPQVETWIRNLLELGLSALHISEWSGISPPEGIQECPKKPSTAPSTSIWVPSYECIKNIEYRMRRESYIHPDDKVAVCQLLQEWSGLSSGMQGHNSSTAGNYHVLYWQDFECYCPVDEGTGHRYCHNSSPNCKPFFAVLQSPWQREFMMKEIENGRGEILGLDASGEATSTRWILHALTMINEYNVGIPIGFALCSDEYSKVVALFLDAIASTSPPNYCPTVMLIDINLVEITGIMQSSWGKAVAIRLCFTKVMQAWLRWCRKMKQRHTKEILALIHSIKWASSRDEVDGLVRAMKAWLEKEGNPDVCDQFENHYFSKMTAAGLIANLWINALRKPVHLNRESGESNNQCEGFFKVLKYRFMEKKVSERVEHLLKVLIQSLGPYYQAKCNEIGSCYPTQWSDEAARKEELARDVVSQNRVTVFDSTLGLGSVLSSKDGALYYHVALKPPSCTCPDTSGVFCKHIRALGRVLGGLKNWGIEISAGCEHNDGTSRVPEPLPSHENEGGGAFQSNHPVASSSMIHPVVPNTPDPEMCSAFQRACSDGSLKLDRIYALQKSLKRVRKVYEQSDAQKFFKCQKLIFQSTKVEPSKAAATWDEFDKILCNAIEDQGRGIQPVETVVRISDTNGEGWPQKAAQPRKESQEYPNDRNIQEGIQIVREGVQADFPGGSMGVNKIILKEGDGRTFPSSGQLVAVHYTGSLADDTKLESSRDRGCYFQFQIGRGKVIKGLDEGVMQMSVGERAVLQCSPDYAYGASGIPNRIPPNSTVYFDVELFKTE